MLRRSSNIAVASAMTLALTMATGAPPASAARSRVAAVRHAAAANPLSLIPRFESRIFARGTTNLFNPDGIVVTKHSVFVVFQNNSDADATKSSTVVKYDRVGHILGSVDLHGRCDGMRYNPETHELWALLNNDGANTTDANGNPAPRQPLLATVNPRSLEAKIHYFTLGLKQPHGGGYDDMAFINGQAYLSASSATIPANGINSSPIIVSATINASGKVDIRPVVKGNVLGYDASTKTTKHLNLTDPDSLAVDNSGDLVLVSEGDQQVAIVAHPGSASPQVTRFGLATGIDDLAWTRGTHGKLFVADTVLNLIYSIDARFPQGTVFVEATAGTPVPSFIGTADASANLTPLLTELNGIVDPTSLIFAGDDDASDD